MNISVIGTGYVGLVTGVCLAEVGHTVTCVDKDINRINKLNDKINPLYEKGLDELLLKNIEEKRMQFTIDYKKACRNSNVFFVGVGTPEQEDGSACLDYVYAAVGEILDNISNDALIVIKSTVPIGTNEKIEEYINENNKSTLK